MAQVMEVTAPPDAGKLLFGSMHAREELGRPFEYQVEVLSTSSGVDPKKILGKPVTVKLELPVGDPRCFNGYVTEFYYEGISGSFYRYRLVLRPWLWMLSRTSDCRIFQNQTTPDIIATIFQKYGIAKVESRLACKYRTWEYCVQYRETDFNFVSRLMEYEGVYYFFEHQADKHVLVLCDGPNAHNEFPGYTAIPFIAHDQAARLDTEYITDWRYACRIQSGAFVLEDFDFKKPSVDLLTQASHPNKHQEAEHEVYDYPGEYIETAHGADYSSTRLEEANARHAVANGAGNARGVATGYVFALTGMPRDDQNSKYLVTAARYELVNNSHEAANTGGASYHCAFDVLPAALQFRSARLTPRPAVQGPQTAIVVGPAGDEIYTDDFGRVKVQFHWDRYGKKNENSSCWIRVASPWAGKNFGMISLPRIGQEVIVDFEEGNPDRPVITGRVFNAEQMPLYALPANKTQSGILTRSSKGGTASNANEIRFEDLKGSEHLLIHAEKDQMIEVEHDESHWVGHDRKKQIDHDETTLVKHDRTETVGNNETITIGVDRSEQVGKNETILVGANRTRVVGANETINVNQNRTKTISIDETDTIGKTWSIQVGMSKSEHIGVTSTQNVGALRMSNVMGIASDNVGVVSVSAVGIERVEVTAGDKEESITGDSETTVSGNETHVVKKTLKISAETIELTATKEIKIACGSSTITVKPSEIEILSPLVNINK